jgi:hypothetical protein
MYVCVLSTSPRKYASHCKVQLARLPLEEGYDPNYNANLGPGFKWHAQPSPHAIGFSGRPASCPCASPSGAFAAPQQIGPNQTSNLTIWRRFSSYAFHLDLAEPSFQTARVAQAKQLHYWREQRIGAGKKMSWQEWRPM